MLGTMFSTSNSIAYSGLMVLAKSPQSSALSAMHSDPRPGFTSKEAAKTNGVEKRERRCCAFYSDWLKSVQTWICTSLAYL